MNNVLKYWTFNEFEVSTYNPKLSEIKNNRIPNKYTYNELGFRGDSINKKGFKIMSIGCSMTEGFGVEDYETWPYFFTKKITNGVNHNFGYRGRSNDYICRCLLTYYDLIKPDLVLIMYTSPHRREIYTSDGGIEPYHATHVWGYLDETDEGKRIQKLKLELQNDEEDFINWYKNHLLIKYFLEVKNCNWIWNGWMGIPHDIKEDNRFDGNYGKPWVDIGSDDKHPGPKHNFQYSNRLFSYIYENFRTYLPKNVSAKNKELI